MEAIKWFFDGIGTEIVGIVFSFIIGVMGGGVLGYKIGIKQALYQKQEAGDVSKQRQELKTESSDVVTSSLKSNVNLKQSQSAGNGSEQIQIGDINVK